MKKEKLVEWMGGPKDGELVKVPSETTFWKLSELLKASAFPDEHRLTPAMAIFVVPVVERNGKSIFDYAAKVRE